MAANQATRDLTAAIAEYVTAKIDEALHDFSVGDETRDDEVTQDVEDTYIRLGMAIETYVKAGVGIAVNTLIQTAMKEAHNG